MNLPRLSASLLLFSGLCLIASAQTSADSNIEVSTGTSGTAKASGPQRSISNDLSKSLSYGIKYTPPPAEPEAKPAESEEEHDSDKPKNGIIRLPKYIVEGKRPPIFEERNLYSKEMLRRMAYQRYMSSFSKNILNASHLLGKGDEAYALMQYEADERKKNMADTADRVAMYRVSGDDEEASRLKADAQDAYMRRSSYNSVPGAGVRPGSELSPGN